MIDKKTTEEITKFFYCKIYSNLRDKKISQDDSNIFLIALNEYSNVLSELKNKFDIDIYTTGLNKKAFYILSRYLFLNQKEQKQYKNALNHIENFNINFKNMPLDISFYAKFKIATKNLLNAFLFK